jgi:hypothetical protein
MGSSPSSDHLRHSGKDEAEKPHSRISAVIINSSVPAVSVGVVSQTSTGDSRPSISEVQSARRASVAVAFNSNAASRKVNQISRPIIVSKRFFKRGFENIHGGAIRVTEALHGHLKGLIFSRSFPDLLIFRVRKALVHYGGIRSRSERSNANGQSSPAQVL